ncbi:MAG: hypothetical protein DRI61_15470, partial [Chloroflexi bacterium]
MLTFKSGLLLQLKIPKQTLIQFMKLIPNLLVLLFITGTTFAQQFSVSGKITSTELAELSYANVRVMNTNLGTAANVEGEYDLKLQAGNYFLIASYIGYYSDTIFVELNRNINGLDFFLQQAKLTLADVVIKPGENPALDIIRKAIEEKKKRNEQLISYEFEAYTKGIVRTEEDFSTKGNSVGLGIGSDDSTELKITGILENKSKGFYKKPDNYKEIIIARKQSANFPPSINTVSGGRVIQNFYDDDVNFFGRDLPGPLSDNALNYYYFYIEQVVLMNDRKVYQIFMAPDNYVDPGFEGSIFITDSTFDLIKVNLRLNRSANTGGIFDTISVIQQFDEYDHIYMPADYRLFLTANFLGLVRVGFELNSILYDYKINPHIPDDQFTKAIVTVLPDADKKDSLYWVSTQSIPNTLEEDSAYERIDSIDRAPVSFWDRFSFLSTRTYLSDSFALNGSLNFYHFNRVEGHSLKLGLYIDDYFKRRLNSSLELSYGFSDKKLKTDFSAEYLLGDYRTYSLTFNAYNKLKILFGTSDAYNDLTATLLALLNKEEFRDYYYSNGLDFEIEGEVFPVLELSAGFINRTDKSAQNNSDFSFFKKDKSYKENPPIYETKINALTAGFKLDFRDYIEDGYFRRRTSFGRSYILFSGDVTYSSKELLSSNLDFITYELRIRSFLRTFRSAYLNMRVYTMYNDGTLPYQNMYALPGNINLVSKNYTFRTLRVNEVFGDRVITVNFEHNFRDELFKMFNIPGL